MSGLGVPLQWRLSAHYTSSRKKTAPVSPNPEVGLTAQPSELAPAIVLPLAAADPCDLAFTN